MRGQRVRLTTVPVAFAFSGILTERNGIFSDLLLPRWATGVAKFPQLNAMITVKNTNNEYLDIPINVKSGECVLGSFGREIMKFEKFVLLFICNVSIFLHVPFKIWHSSDKNKHLSETNRLIWMKIKRHSLSPTRVKTVCYVNETMNAFVKERNCTSIYNLKLYVSLFWHCN